MSRRGFRSACPGQRQQQRTVVVNDYYPEKAGQRGLDERI